MKRFWKEYGWLALSIALAMVGYAIFTQHKEDIVSYSLDAIGSRLVAMVEAPDQKATIAALFESYKQRILSHEVAPDQVASMAANVLNLSNSGARLSPAEAELILTYPAAAPAAAEGPVAAGEASPVSTPAVSPGALVPPASPEALTALGERLALLLAFNDQVQGVARLDGEVQADLAAQVKYHVDGGLRVLLDPRLQDRLSKRDFARLHGKLSALEKKKLVVWQVHLADSVRAHQEHVRHKLQALRVLQEHHGVRPSWDTLQIAPIEALLQLEANGFIPGPGRDSLSAVVQAAFDRAEVLGLEAQAEALEAAARDLEAAYSAKERATPSRP